MAQMKIDLQVMTSDGVVEKVTAGPADMIALERRYSIGTGALADAANSRIEYLAFLAWNAIRRTRAGVPDFDAWLDTLDSLETTGGDESGGKAGQPS